jgi:aminopeptidase N
MRPFVFKLVFLLLTPFISYTQPFSAIDSLRGSNNPNRMLWDVRKYELSIEPHFNEHSIKGINRITFYDYGTKLMQIELQEPMVLDSVLHHDVSLPFSKNGSVYTVMFMDTNSLYQYKVQPGIREIDLFFHGKPTVAKRAPWDGGWVWQTDSDGNPWASVACQSEGASLWFPCKDILSDKADSGAVMHLITPAHLIGIGNGRLMDTRYLPGNRTMYSWKIQSPVSAYNLIPYFGRYAHFSDTLHGEKGILDLNYYVLPEHLEKAGQQFKQVKSVLHAMEYWAGPYPFYNDGYKLVEAPYLGMEHQSNIAYGNGYTNGYKGKDLSASGAGLLWDFIIMHESAHEWFGNAITAEDVAYLWIHEGFTTYAEVLYTGYLSGKTNEEKYLSGTYKRILNDAAIQAIPGFRREGSSDMYPKGAALVHVIRSLMNDDERFRQALRSMQDSFYLKPVSPKMMLQYWNVHTNINLARIFEQFTLTTQVPVLQWKKVKKRYYVQWSNCVNNFDMPVDIRVSRKKSIRIYPTTEWQWIKEIKKSPNITGDLYMYLQKII